jgi:hypothetical protein
MGRPKKIVEEVNIINVLEDTPHHSFCFGCKNSDIRVIKDNLNLAVLTINRICQELDIDKERLKEKCKKIDSWIEEQKKFRVLQSIKADKERKKANKKNKGIVEE